MKVDLTLLLQLVNRRTSAPADHQQIFDIRIRTLSSCSHPHALMQDTYIVRIDTETTQLHFMNAKNDTYTTIYALAR